MSTTDDRVFIAGTMYAAHSPAASDDMVERIWQALKKRCCVEPAKAHRCVMVNKADLAAAIAAMNQEKSDV